MTSGRTYSPQDTYYQYFSQLPNSLASVRQRVIEAYGSDSRQGDTEQQQNLTSITMLCQLLF